MNKIVNGVLDGNIDVFIVPNRVGKISSHWLKSTVKNIATVVEMNNLEFNPESDKIVELWFTGMDCDSWTDHYIHAEDEDGNKVCFRASNIGYLPASIFFNKNEGDTVDITFPATVYKVRKDRRTPLTEEEAEYSREIVVKIHATLAQNEYRYSRFGSFEEVLQKVV